VDDVVAGRFVQLSEDPDLAVAAPTPDHFLLLAYLAGMAATSGEATSVSVDGYAAGSRSMTSYRRRGWHRVPRRASIGSAD